MKWPLGVMLLLLSTLLMASCTRVAAQAGPGAAGAAGSPALLYTCNQMDATVSVIDMATLEVVRTVDLQALGFSANAKPHHVAVEPDGSFWYLSLIGESKVLKFNRADELVAQADFETPGMLVLDPKADALYVGRSMSAVNPPARIGVIRRSDFSVDEVEVFFPRPHALAASPDGRFVYTASLAENRMAALETASMEITLADLPGPIHTLVQFAVSPDGNTMVAGGQLTGKLFIFDTSTPPALPVLATVEVAAAPWHPVYTPDGRYVFLGNKNANVVTVLDVAVQKVVAEIRGEGIAEPHGAAVSPDGRFVFISNNNMKMDASMNHEGGHAMLGTVVAINTETLTIEKVIPVGHMPTGLGAAAR